MVLIPLFIHLFSYCSTHAPCVLTFIFSCYFARIPPVLFSLLLLMLLVTWECACLYISFSKHPLTLNPDLSLFYGNLLDSSSFYFSSNVWMFLSLFITKCLVLNAGWLILHCRAIIGHGYSLIFLRTLHFCRTSLRILMYISDSASPSPIINYENKSH
jgi:hypothetical protein